MPPREFPALEQKLKALASKRRLQILSILRKKHTTTVSTLARKLGISVQAASKHLTTLARAEIVHAKRRGMYVTYRLALHQDPLVKHILKRL